MGMYFERVDLPGGELHAIFSLTVPDVRGRHVREVDFQADGVGLKLGDYNAFDYFGDGSFYLLDCPGVSPSSSTEFPNALILADPL